MPVSYRIFPEHALVLVTYAGVAGLAETTRLADLCARDPLYSASLRHLVDLRRLEDYERDFVGYFSMQAEVMRSFQPHPDQMYVYIATNRPGQEMAQLVRRSWDGLNWAITRIVTDEAQAIEILGLRLESLSVLAAPD
jgi:hypothetical protein